MWSHERQGKILEILVRYGKVMTNQLADLFSVSRETVRRDLLEMEETGSLTRVHGGALLSGAEIAPEPAFDVRRSADASAKDAIGEAACALIEPGMTLMIDTGTTTLAFARALGEFGATLMIAGNLPGRTQTLSVAIYEAVQAGQDGKANALVILTSVVCIVILLLAARLVGGRRRELRDVA